MSWIAHLSPGSFLPVVKMSFKIFPFLVCSVEQNGLYNFGRGHYAELF